MSSIKEGFTLSIVSHSLGTDPTTKKPLNPHWSFHLDNKQARTLLYRWSTWTVRLWGRGKKFLMNSQSKDMIIRIGAVPEGRVDELDYLLNQVPIRKDIGVDASTEWGNYRSCHDWCLDAIEPLRRAGFIDSGMTTDIIKAALRPDWTHVHIDEED